MTGSLPDLNLSLDFSDLVGKLRREANTASRSGQYESLNRLADEMLSWQSRLRRALLLALGEESGTKAWATIVNQVNQVRHERDGAQQVSTYNAEQLREYDAKWTAQREELEELRREKK